MMEIAREVGNIAFAVAVAWYLLTQVAKRLDEVADSIKRVEITMRELVNELKRRGH